MENQSHPVHYTSANDIQQLKKALEWELSLDSRDLRSNAWYHGPIPRQRAEEIVINEGDFLVRDCVSQPGNFVLTCRATTTLHFVINKLVQQRETVYERVQYQFEDDAYDSVADLITYYVGSGRSISAASGARISTPCNRTFPLSFYSTKYGIPANNTYAGFNSGAPDINNSNAIGLPPRLPAKKPLMTGTEDKFKSLKLHSSSLSLAATKAGKFNSLPRPSIDVIPTNQAPSPPPKPRTMQMQRDNSIEARVYRYHTSGSDSGNGSGDSVHSAQAFEPAAAGEANPGRGVVIRNPKYISHSVSSVTLTNYSDFDPTQMEEYLDTLELTGLQLKTQFDLDNYETLLLPVGENKPLDNNALNTFHMMLFENAATIIAHHLTRANLKVVMGLQFPPASAPATLDENGEELNLIAKLQSGLNGLELMTLQEGGQFRVDLVERLQCLKLMVAVTILTCGSDEERAETLNKWIQVATEAKNAYGDLFGFGAIVLGINMPQIQSLNATWHVLRQKFTNNAFLFEAKMRPMLKAMNEANYQQAPNTTIPYIVPYALMRDRSVGEILGVATGEESDECSLWRACVQPWVTSSSDDGLGITFSHLEAVRGYINNLPTFKQNAQIFMKDSSIRYDELLEDAFRTEFHMKFLWGTKGALNPAQERFSKLEQILSLMAERFCNVSGGGQ